MGLPVPEAPAPAIERQPVTTSRAARVVVTAVLVSVLTVLAPVASPASARPAGADDRARRCRVPAAREVLVLGDSLTRGSADAGDLAGRLAAEGFRAVAVDAEVGRTTAGGLQRLQERSSVPVTVVVALGTNDVSAGRSVTRWAKTVRTVVDYLGDGRTVLWVNVALARTRAEAERTRAYNRVLARLADQRQRVHLVDWASGSGADPALLRPDGVHLTADGYAARSRAVVDALVAVHGRGPALPAGCR